MFCTDSPILLKTHDHSAPRNPSRDGESVSFILCCRLWVCCVEEWSAILDFAFICRAVLTPPFNEDLVGAVGVWKRYEVCFITQQCDTLSLSLSFQREILSSTRLAALPPAFSTRTLPPQASEYAFAYIQVPQDVSSRTYTPIHAVMWCITRLGFQAGPVEHMVYLHTGWLIVTFRLYGTWVMSHNTLVFVAVFGITYFWNYPGTRVQ